MTVEEHLRANLQETQEFVKQEAIDKAVATATTVLLASGTDLDDLSEFARAYVGDFATVLVIPSAIDYYMVRTRRSDATAGPGVTPLGGESSANYDRVAALKDMTKLLESRLARLEDVFLNDVGDASGIGSSSTFPITISGYGKDLKTPSPDVMPGIEEALIVGRKAFGIYAYSGYNGDWDAS